MWNIDDTTILEIGEEEHWWCTLQFLGLLETNGYILNTEEDIFQFCRKAVKFAGYKVSESKV